MPDPVINLGGLQCIQNLKQRRLVQRHRALCPSCENHRRGLDDRHTVALLGAPGTPSEPLLKPPDGTPASCQQHAGTGYQRWSSGGLVGVLGVPGGSPVPARPHEPGLVGDDHQLCPVPRPELHHGAADVGLGGSRADIESSGDLGVGQSFPD